MIARPCSSLAKPATGGPVVAAAADGAEHDHPVQPLRLAQAERNVERHPVMDEIEAIHQIGVLAQFPAAAVASPSVSSGSRLAAMASIASLPRRSTAHSI